MVTKNAIGEWLEAQYLQWRLQDVTNRRSVRQFAQWLGIPTPTLNNWINGNRMPNKQSIARLAEKLGPEIYDVLGQPRPDPRLQQIIEGWSKLSERDRNQIAEQAARYVTGREEDAP